MKEIKNYLIVYFGNKLGWNEQLGFFTYTQEKRQYMIQKHSLELNSIDIALTYVKTIQNHKKFLEQHDAAKHSLNQSKRCFYCHVAP